MPETVHVQAVANYERVAFSVAFPESRLLFVASVRRFATVVVVDSEDVHRALLAVRGGVKSGTRFQKKKEWSWRRNRQLWSQDVDEGEWSGRHSQVGRRA